MSKALIISVDKERHLVGRQTVYTTEYFGVEQTSLGYLSLYMKAPSLLFQVNEIWEVSTSWYHMELHLNQTSAPSIYMYMVYIYTYLYKMTFIKWMSFENEFYGFQPSSTQYSKEKCERTFLCARRPLRPFVSALHDRKLKRFRISASSFMVFCCWWWCFFHFLQMSACLSLAAGLFHFLLIAISNLVWIEKSDKQAFKNWLQMAQFCLKALLPPE